MYILVLAIIALWFYSVYAFATWRFHYCSNKGRVLETVLHDRVTNLYLRFTAGTVLALIFYII
jgi:hypothetical protein